LLAAGRAAAAMQLPGKETVDAESAYIQDLLKKTEAMREQRKAERLADYYRRNFREYLNFDSGAAKSRGISDETAAAIKQWLLDNPASKNPWHPDR